MPTRPDWSREGARWPNRTSSRFVTAANLRWHVQVMGDGPVLLLLHGAGAATHSFRSLAPLLARRFTVVAPDLPGHGFTDPARHARALPAVAAAVGALVAALALPPAIIVGHSAGAAIATRMALDRHVAPAAIVSINGALLPFPGLAGRLFPQLARLLFDNALTPQLFAMQARLPGAVAAFLERSTASRIDPAGIAQYEALFRTPGHCAGALGMMAEWDLDALERDLPKLVPPLILVAAGRDASIPPSVAHEVARRLPAARVVPLPGLGHLAHEERPDLVAAIVVDAAVAHGVELREAA